ncbi:MAG: 1-deoxy-D-xylulose-5-phosphate reductoisomerase [Dehalococcoidia bacterium]
MGDNVKRLAILGSTGSIGQQTLEVVRSFPNKFQVMGLAAGRNLELLAKQIGQFQPKLVSIGLADWLPSSKCELLSLEEMVSHPDVDLVVVAVTGKAALAPTLEAIRAKKSIALATKEVLVMAGEIVISEAKRHGAQILPIDSEPSAIWQCLRGEEGGVSRLILTASGGPFQHLSPDALAKVTPQQALNHPTWKMGEKVTIDSATLINKGFEVIEAHWLFDTPLEKIEVVIHPQSIVHSFVEFVDGSIKAQLSLPDMRLPIQYALFYPERAPNELSRLDFSNIGALTFEAPDLERFPCLRLALEAGRKKGTYPTVLSAADEVAVELFLQRRIGFLDIAKLVAEALEQHQSTPCPSLQEVLAADAWARGRIGVRG